MIKIETPTFSFALNTDESTLEGLEAFFGGLNRKDIKRAIENNPGGIAVATEDNVEFVWNLVGEIYGHLRYRNEIEKR